MATKKAKNFSGREDMRHTVVVLGGGDSPEREVSLRSSAAVVRAAKDAGYDVQVCDPKDGLGFLDKLSKNAVVLPILHGVGGEDGELQAKLEKYGLRYLGADSEASKLCFDKHLTRQRLAESNLPIPRGAAIKRAEYDNHPIAQKPHILKVARGGSSIGTLFVQDPETTDIKKVDEIFSLDNLAIIEELVDGTEITVPILGGRALPVIEICPPENGEFDYKNKYNGKTQEFCPPVSISADLQQKAQDLAKQVHRVTGCRHLSRVDIIIRPDDSMVVLEINTLPGMTEQSLYPKSAKEAGISITELVDKFVYMAIKGEDSES